MYVVFSGVLQPKNTPNTEDQQAVQNVPTRTPEDVGLTMTARSDNRAIEFVLTKIDGIKSVDYELTYTATGAQNRGIIGTITVKQGDQTISSGFLDLGSCSSGVCKYDTGVKSVGLQLNITKTDGSTYQVNDTLKLQ